MLAKPSALSFPLGVELATIPTRFYWRGIMGRLLFLILLIALIVYFVKRYLGKKNPDEKTSADNAQQQSEHLASEDMVQCATCQVHIARSEAFLVKQRFYCCTAHVPKK
jgi:Na+-transporting methylmalonyl-CoA/oxaloacetate decarboxylase gamma subunit